MAFSIPAHTPFPWHNEPAVDTPVDAAYLTLFGNDNIAYVQSVISAYDTYALSTFTGTGQTGWVTKSSNYHLLATDSGVCVTATATITLPTTPGHNLRYGVKNFGVGVTVTVTTGSSAVIDSGGGINATSTTLSAKGQSMDFALAPNGVDWILVSAYTQQIIATQPPAISIGINVALGWDGAPHTLSLAALGRNHITYARGTYDSSDTADSVQNILANGLHVAAAIIGNDVAGVTDSVKLSTINQTSWVTATVAQIDDAVSRAGANVPLEVINEPFFKGGQAEPATYAAMFHALRAARPSANLLFAVTGDYQRVDLSFSQLSAGGGWLGDAKTAVPSIVNDVSGFVHHPYGNMLPTPSNDNGGGGPGGLDYCHGFAVSMGYNTIACKSWYLTEYGSAFPTAADGDTQAADLTRAFNYFINLGYVKNICWFQMRDFTGTLFGLFNDDFTDRPSSTAAKTIAIAQGQ